MSERAEADRAEPTIARFEAELRALESRPTSTDAGAFAAHFRRLSQQLALARYRGYRAQWVERLNDLALRGHAELYRRSARHRDWSAMLARVVGDVPRAVRRHLWAVGLAALLFYGSYLATFLVVSFHPDLILSFMSQEQVLDIESMYEPAGAAQHARDASADVGMFGFYIFNNVGIAFRTFASGVFAGIGSLFFLIYNGISLGAVSGHLQNAGMSSTFYPFVIGHGAFELNAIVLSGAAGLVLGWSFLSPGRRRRVDSFARSARSALPLVYGFSVMLVVAAVLEAFWSSSVSLGNNVRYAVGGVLWVAVLAFLSGVGTSRGA